ncbi:MAG: glycerophosphodiester phosphodiesterase family protein [Isosphaeraceae bacterium]|jgi:glycerophosphoryl diester phosphodiesterase
MAARSFPEPLISLAGGVLGDFRRLFVPLAWFELVFKGVVALLGFAGGAGLLAILMESTGTSAVTNTDIVEFLLTPVGVLVVAMLGLSTLLGIVLEHLGVMAIAARFQRGQKIDALGITRILGSLLLRLLRLGAAGLALLVLTAAPLALLGGLTYAAFLSAHDINYYLADRPPSFIAAVIIGGLLGAIFLVVIAYSYVRTVLLFPIILYEDQPAWPALRESLNRTRGAFRRLGTILLGWQIAGVLLSTALVSGFAVIAGLLLHIAARFWVLVPLVALLLALHAIFMAALSFLLVATHCLLILRLYRERNLALGVVGPESVPVQTDRSRDALEIASLLRSWKLGALASLAVFVGLCISMSQRCGTPGNVIVTAHRGFSKVAPENSKSAIQKAIEAGADYAEIDVQETADGVIILNHDSDLMRVAGVPAEISAMTLDEVRGADIGKKFSSAFAAEKVPTLAEVIALARDRIKLQIELKYYDREGEQAKGRNLAVDVVRLVEREHFESQCIVSSLNYEALMEVRRYNPRIHTAAIVTLAIGDIDRLDVDALSVNAKSLSNRLICAARAQHKDVYAWTVDDPRQMIKLIERGVSNILTNVPDVLVRLRTEFAGLSHIERRLLAARYLLGLEPELVDRPSDETAAEAVRGGRSIPKGGSR